MLLPKFEVREDLSSGSPSVAELNGPRIKTVKQLQRDPGRSQRTLNTDDEDLIVTAAPSISIRESTEHLIPNMGHRNYAAGVLGRFISRDPIGFNGSSMNLYAYPTNPVNFVDPSGLDFEVYVNDFCRVFTPDELSKVGPYLRSRAHLVTGMQLNGHSGTTLGGADPRKGQMGGLWWDRWGEQGVQDGVLIFWKNKSTGDWDYYNLSDVQFPKLEFIRLKGCNTAGGHPEPEEMKRRYPKHAENYHDPPTSENISRFLSERYNKTLVTGNKGPSWNANEKWDFPATYQNGASVPNPANVIKK